MPLPDHGTRSRYQSGCHCVACRVAEAMYRKTLRGKHVKGLPILGAIISAVEAHRKIRQLKAERLSKAEIARRLGLKRPILEWHPERIRIKSALRLHRLIRELMLEGGEAPISPIQDTHGAAT